MKVSTDRRIAKMIGYIEYICQFEMIYLFLLDFIWLIEPHHRSSRGRGTPSPYQRGRRSIRGRPQPIVWQDG